MLDTQPLWSVVATVDEPPQLVQAFVAWHLALGADQIHLYFDRPDDPTIALLSHLPQVIITGCDEAYWTRSGKSRPHRHELRQTRNARDAYCKTKSAWLLHCDADEFIWSSGLVAGQLSDTEPAADAIAVPVAERVYLTGQTTMTIFEGAFRRPFPARGKEGRNMFGPDFDMTYRGLTGHAVGKAFVRTGRPLHMAIHRPASRDKDRMPHVVRSDPKLLELLHFEGLTPQYWIYKLLRMAERQLNQDGMPMPAHRLGQADALFVDPDAGRDLHDRLKSIDTGLQAKLSARDLLVQPPFDVTSALNRYFPDQQVNLSPSAIDEWLRAKKAGVLSFLHK